MMSLPVFLQAVAQDVEVEDEEDLRQCLQKTAANSHVTWSSW